METFQIVISIIIVLLIFILFNNTKSSPISTSTTQQQPAQQQTQQPAQQQTQQPAQQQTQQPAQQQTQQPAQQQTQQPAQQQTQQPAQQQTQPSASIPITVSTNNIIDDDCAKDKMLKDLSKVALCYTDWMEYPISEFTLQGGDEKLITRKDHIAPNIRYTNNYTWTSVNNKFKLVMQSDGNLVQYNIADNKVIWSTKTNGNPGAMLCMQRDGNLVIYTVLGVKLWETKTNVTNGYCILWQSGLFVLYNADSTINKFINFNILNITGLLPFQGEYIKGQISNMVLQGGNGLILAETARIQPNILYCNNFTWVNGIYSLIIQTDGNLVLYKNNTIPIWHSGTHGNPGAYFGIQKDGNMVVYRNNQERTKLWESNTNGTNVIFAELANTGFIALLDTKYAIIKIYPELNPIITYLKRVHWENSPWTIFSDKKGRVWKATWSDLNKDLNIDYNDNFKRYAQDTCGSADKNAWCPFRGWRKGASNLEWYKDMSNPNNPQPLYQLDLNHGTGYKFGLNNHLPVQDRDSDEYNYRSRDDRINFETIDKYQKRKPPQLANGIGKPTYIPGYKLLSYSNGQDNDNTFNFLISARSGSNRDQAFTVFHIFKNKDAYANDIYNNHPDLISKIRAMNDETRNIIVDYHGEMVYYQKGRCSSYYSEYLKNKMNNKSFFQNKNTNSFTSFFSNYNPFNYFK